ncbi:MAG: family hydrolase [Firmicutes bacterium]|nr:family hydrolase [Bacillota bacterium]
MKKFDAVIFDLDGTLLYTLDDVTDSMNYMLGKHKFPLRSRDEIRSFVGEGAGQLMERAIPGGKRNPEYDKCLADYFLHYFSNMLNKTYPFEGIPETVKKLHEGGYKMAVVSNKIDNATKELTQKFFGDYIKVAIGQTRDTALKPAPDTVFQALCELEADPGKAVYVGDMEIDIETARNSGTVCVAVTWGYRDRKFLEENGAEYIIDRPQELLDIVGFNK